MSGMEEGINEDEELGIYDDDGGMSEPEIIEQPPRRPQPSTIETAKRQEAISVDSSQPSHLATTNAHSPHRPEYLQKPEPDRSSFTQSIQNLKVGNTNSSEPLQQPVTSNNSTTATQLLSSNEQEDSSRAFSADPALAIKRLSNTARTSKTTPRSAMSNQTREAERTPRPLNSAVTVTSNNMFVPTTNKAVEYIQRKCIRTDTRSSASFYSPSETPLSTVSDRRSQVTQVSLHQNRPSPMAPLQAWKGYSGNIYFSPIKIERVNSASGEIESVSRSQLDEPEFSPSVEKTQRQSKTAKADIPKPVHCDVPSRPAIKMDKEFVMNKKNAEIKEDLYWIRNSETLGSLKIERGAGDRAKEKRSSHKALRKGSVAHQLAMKKQEKGLKSHILIANSQHNLSKYMNPLLKATTQYSQSTTRPKTNSPDVTHRSSYDKLPPLEQLRASLRDLSGKTGTHKPKLNKSAKTTQTIDSIPTYVKLDRKVAREMQRVKELASDQEH